MGLEVPLPKSNGPPKALQDKATRIAFYYATKWFTIIRATAKGEPRYAIVEGGT